MEFLIKSTSILSLFYFFYFIFLQKDTFFNSIRFYFLAGIISSIALPLITIKKYIILEMGQVVNTVEPSIINNSVQITEITWLKFFGIIYIVGVLFFFIKFLIQLISIFWFIFSNEKVKYEGIFYIKTSRNITPFSFFNFVVYNPIKFEKEELKPIIAHEKVHVNQLHSLDHILSQFLVIFNWFNPFAWLFAKEIQKNLEFIADDIAQVIAPKTKDYQQLLLKTISPNYHLALTTNFYNSIIKKRINMLQKNRSNGKMQIKFALIIPVLIGFIITFNTEVIAQQKEESTIEEFKVEVQTDKIIEYEIITKDTKDSELIKMKNTFKSNYGTQFKYSKLKRNKEGEITSISLDVKTKSGKQASFNQKSSNPISPILISINHTSGELSIGNTTENSTSYTERLASDYIPKTNSFVYVSTDDTSEDGKIRVKVNSENRNGYTFVTSDKDQTGTYEVVVETDSISVNSEKGEGNIWIVKKDDLDKSKKIKIVELNRSKGDGKTHRVIIETNGDTTSENIILNGKKVNVDQDVLLIESDDASQFVKSSGRVKFIESGDKKPLIYLNGKELKNKNINDIDVDNIKTIQVLKGDKAIEKYGKKAKDGVILISTKK